MRFRRNRLGYWSLVAFCVMVVLSLGAELISNDRPLVVRYEGQTYWPLWNDYSEKTFGGDFETAADYLDPYIRDRLSQGKNSIDAWWISLSTFAVLVVTLLLLTFMGDALRDALDPRKAAATDAAPAVDAKDAA